jgi:CheY-like chemotaxis protein
MTATSSKGRILVMDDEELICKMLSHALSISGYKVFLSRHGLEAIELYELAKKSGRPFDALIMDLKIKNGMDGDEAMQRLIDIDPEVKAIASSADLFHPAMLDHKNYGFKGTLPKPYSIKELQKTLSRLIHEQEESVS